ncbi:hypothetical protein D9M68_643350 [compost metagenome]
MAGDGRGDALRVELLGQDRTDDAEAVARRRHVHRQPATEHQALFDGLVTVAVAQGELVLADAGHEDRAVGAGGTVEHRIAGVGAEDPRGIGFRLADRAAVVEYRAEVAALDAAVGTKQVLAEEVEEHPAHRRFGEGDAALVPRRCPGVLLLQGVADQRIGERWQQVLEVALDRGHHPPGDKGCGVLEHPDEFVGQFHGFDRETLLGAAIGHQKHRHMLVALADGAQQFQGQDMAGAVILAQGPVDADAVQRGVGDHRRQPVLVGGGLDHLGIAVVELSHQVVQHPAPRTHRIGQVVVDQQHAFLQLNIRASNHEPSPRATDLPSARFIAR